MLKHVLIVFLLLYVSMGAKASENLSDHEVFCMKTDQDCLTYIQSRLLNTQKNSSNWYNESPRVHRRPVCLSQATLPDSFKLS